MQELAMIEKGSELQTLTDGLPKFIEKIKSAVDVDDADVDTKKGRAEIVSNAFKITKAKTSIASKIDDLIESKEKEIEPTLKIISTLKASKKTTNAELTELSKSTRKVVTDWETEEEKRIEVEKDRLKSEALEIEKESDYSSALVEDELFEMKLSKKLDAERVEREALEAKEKEEKAARDKKIADDATAKAKIDAEAKTAKAIQDKLDAEAATKQAVIDQKVAEELAAMQKAESDERARVAKINSDNAVKEAKIQAAKDKKAAEEKATQDEKDRQEAVKAAAEKERLKVEANRKHVSKIRGGIKEDLILATGIDNDTAVKIVKALLKIERITINYL